MNKKWTKRMIIAALLALPSAAFAASASGVADSFCALLGSCPFGG